MGAVGGSAGTLSLPESWIVIGIDLATGSGGSGGARSGVAGIDVGSTAVACGGGLGTSTGAWSGGGTSAGWTGSFAASGGVAGVVLGPGGTAWGVGLATSASNCLAAVATSSNVTCDFTK